MLSKAQFKKILTAIVAQHRRDDDIADAIKIIVPSCHIVCEPGPAVGALSALLEDLMEDQYGWISYWLWDLDQGSKWERGKVKVDGRGVRLKTMDDLYRMLKKEAKR